MILIYHRVRNQKQIDGQLLMDQSSMRVSIRKCKVGSLYAAIVFHISVVSTTFIRTEGCGELCCHVVSYFHNQLVHQRTMQTCQLMITPSSILCHFQMRYESFGWSDIHQSRVPQ